MQRALSTTYWFGFGGFAITGAALGTHYGYTDAMDGLPRHYQYTPMGFFKHTMSVVSGTTVGTVIGCACGAVWPMAVSAYAFRYATERFREQ
jgi:hypothetical protein